MRMLLHLIQTTMSWRIQIRVKARTRVRRILSRKVTAMQRGTSLGVSAVTGRARNGPLCRRSGVGKMPPVKKRRARTLLNRQHTTALARVATAPHSLLRRRSFRTPLLSSTNPSQCRCARPLCCRPTSTARNKPLRGQLRS